MRALVCVDMCLSISVRVLHEAMQWSKCGGVAKLEKNPKKKKNESGLKKKSHIKNLYI